MNWSKTLIAGVVSGIALFFYEWLFHGIIMKDAYGKYPEAFEQGGDALHFLLVAVCVSIAVAILFSKTRSYWAEGAKGGATYGFFVGLILFFTYFYNPMVIEGYPYYITWCQGSITLIAMVVVGAVQGLVIKK